jgi:hypothetical protein
MPFCGSIYVFTTTFRTYTTNPEKHWIDLLHLESLKLRSQILLLDEKAVYNGTWPFFFYPAVLLPSIEGNAT